MSDRLLRLLLVAGISVPPAAAERIPRGVGAAPDTVAVLHRRDAMPPTPLPGPRASAAAAAVGGKLYVFGGWDGTRWREEMFSFDGYRWERSEAMPWTPMTVAATTRPDDKILVVGGPAPLGGDSSWSMAPQMNAARNLGQALRLRDGRILVAGGFEGDVTSLDSVEIYDPRTRVWAKAAPMGVARYSMVLALLPDGRVLAAGGRTNLHNTRAADTDYSEIYDPASDAWTATSPMLEAYDNMLTYVRPDGKVMAVGGYRTSDQNLAVTEIFDPATLEWRRGPPMRHPRNAASGATLKDGRFLVTGGSGLRGVQETAEIFDPASETWSDAAPMSSPRYNHALVTLPDGRVLVTGGASSNSPNVSAEVYDPGADAWTQAMDPRNAHTQGAAALIGGKVVVTGGTASPSATPHTDIFDPATGRWSPGADLSSGRAFLTLVALDADAALALGGAPNGYPAPSVATVEMFRAVRPASAQASRYGRETYVFDPKQGWSSGPPRGKPRKEVSLVTAGEKIFSFGGSSPDGIVLPNFEVLERGFWRVDPNLPLPLAGSAYAEHQGKVYAAGGAVRGFGGQRDRADFREYDPAGPRWTDLPPLSIARSDAAAAVLDGKMYVAGGRAGIHPADDVEAFDFRAGRWTPVARLPRAVSRAAAAVLGGKLYLVGGATDASPASALVQVYDPQTDSWLVADQARDLPRLVVAPSAPLVPAPPRVAPSPPPPTAPRFAARSRERPHDYALIVGVGYYKSLPAADYAENDAREVAAALQALGVPEENTVSLIGAKATLSEVSKYVDEWLPRRVSPDSRVYFFYSGHGSPDVKDGTAYMMPWDGDPAFVKSTGFPLQRLYDSLSSLKAARVVAMIDSCFSGAGGRSVLVAGVRPLVTVKLPDAPSPKITVLTAAEGEEVAGSLPERGHGLFSYYLIQGLTGAAAPDAEHLTVDELYAFVRKGVILGARRQNREQNPTLRTPNGKIRLY